MEELKKTTKILSFEEIKCEDNELYLDDVDITYCAAADCSRTDDECVNTIKFQTANNGVARYIIFSTDRWAIDPDNIDEFVTLIEDFKKRAGLNNDNN